VLLALPASSQQPQPQVRVNVLNVCTPSAEEQQEIAATLAKIPKRPMFAEDFEISRGRSTLSGKAEALASTETTKFSEVPIVANWVRIRRDFAMQATFANVQYSFSHDSKLMVETLVLRLRDPKDVLQVAIEDSALSVTTPAAMLEAGTPASRIKLERFGKSSVVLARCRAEEGQPAPDQSAYEPLFASASSLLATYRAALGAQSTVPGELARIQAAALKSKPAAKKLGKP
jgi:hypothetical protein